MYRHEPGKSFKCFSSNNITLFNCHSFTFSLIHFYSRKWYYSLVSIHYFDFLIMFYALLILLFYKLYRYRPINSFKENLNNQGKLIMQDTLFVGNAKTQTRPVERRVFLFEKILILSEPLERKANLYYYIYTHHIKVCKVLSNLGKPLGQMLIISGGRPSIFHYAFSVV